MLFFDFEHHAAIKVDCEEALNIGVRNNAQSIIMQTDWLSFSRQGILICLFQVVQASCLQDCHVLRITWIHREPNEGNADQKDLIVLRLEVLRHLLQVRHLGNDLVFVEVLALLDVFGLDLQRVLEHRDNLLAFVLGFSVLHSWRARSALDLAVAEDDDADLGHDIVVVEESQVLDRGWSRQLKVRVCSDKVGQGLREQADESFGVKVGEKSICYLLEHDRLSFHTEGGFAAKEHDERLESFGFGYLGPSSSTALFGDGTRSSLPFDAILSFFSIGGDLGVVGGRRIMGNLIDFFIAELCLGECSL